MQRFMLPAMVLMNSTVYRELSIRASLSTALIVVPRPVRSCSRFSSKSQSSRLKLSLSDNHSIKITTVLISYTLHRGLCSINESKYNLLTGFVFRAS